MSYELVFDPRALKEWKKLGATIREQFKKKLAEVLEHPRVEAAKLRELTDCYKIKLRSSRPVCAGVNGCAAARATCHIVVRYGRCSCIQHNVRVLCVLLHSTVTR